MRAYLFIKRALKAGAGLGPPIGEIADVLRRRFARQPLLLAVQIDETVDPASLADVESRFDWSSRRVYALNAPGHNHGILPGSAAWAPE